MNILEEIYKYSDSEYLLPPSKPLFTRCACGRWYVELLFVTGEKLLFPITFDSREEAAAFTAIWIAAEGIETRKLS
jgi:hypothetical protein